MAVIIRSHLGDGMWAKCSSSQGQTTSIIAEQCTQFPFQGRASVHPVPAPVGNVVVLGWERIINKLDLNDVYGGFFVLSDVRPGYCYTALTNGRCSNQLPQSITKMQCCCDVGRCWSPGVTVTPEMCPIRATGKNPSIYPLVSQLNPHKPRGNVHAANLVEIWVS